MDIKAFKKQKWEHRNEFIPAPILVDFFKDEIERAKADSPDKDEDTIILENVGFRVRGLKGAEYGYVREKVAKRKNTQDLIAKILGEDYRKVGDLLGNYFNPDLDDRSCTALFYFEKALVWPEMEKLEKLEVARILLDQFPNTLFQISNKVELLTGLGSTPGESIGCGNSQK